MILLKLQNEQVGSRDMITVMKHKKLLPRHHTGKLAHRHHTHYGPLLAVMILAFAPLMMISNSVAAEPGDPVSDSHGVYAVVSEPAPTVAPSIRSISDGQVFTTTDLVTISGSCPGNTIVKVFKNQVMAGAGLCQNGLFSVDINLFLGANSIIARAYNNNNLAGPDSQPVNVRLDTGNLTPANLGSQLFVTSETYYQGVRTGESLTWKLIISGGQAPYAVSVSWGDGKTDLISRGQAGTFVVEHIYDKAGDGYRNSYDVTVQVTDQQGNESFLHVVSIVNGDQPSVVSSVKAGYQWSGTMRTAWQLMALAAAIIVGFWLGEKYEVRILKKKYNIVS